MSITGLEWFHKYNNPDGMVEINILDRITQWKEKHPDRQPTIVIQLATLIYSIHRRYFNEMICGNRNHRVVKRIEAFLEKLKKAGAKLVFFATGLKRPHDETRPVFQDEDEFKIYTQLFKTIDENGRIDYNMWSCRDYSSYLGIDEVSIANKYGELHFVYRNYIYEMVTYVKDNNMNVLAILAASSKLLIFDYVLGDVEYWSAESCYLNTKMLTTEMFDFQKLNDFLRLSKEQNALFSAILMTHEREFNSNMELPFLSRENFETCIFYNHEQPKYNRGSYCYKRIKIVASYVITEFPMEVLVDGAAAPTFDKVIRDVFNCEPSDNLKTILQKRYDYYNELKFNMKEEGNNDEPLELLQGAKSFPFVHNVLFQNTIFIPPPHFAFIDLDASNENIKSFADLMLTIYKKYMGILLQHRNDEQLTCKISSSHFHWVLFRQNSEDKTVVGDYPEIQVPDLKQLIFGETEVTDELEAIKWQLLWWTLSIPFDERIQDVPDELKPVVIALMFLRKEEQLTEKEADAILITEFDYTKERIVEKPNDYPRILNGRTVRVAHFYVQIRRLINQSFRICGLHQYAKSQNFDGIYFHNLLEKYKNELLYKIALNKNVEMKKYRLYAN